MSSNENEQTQSNGATADYFDLFGLPHIFGIDQNKLEKQFHVLQSEHHPDRHTQADVETRGDVLERSSNINRAYRTLKDQISRTRYLLSLYRASEKSTAALPQVLLMSVMEVQEKVSEFANAEPEARAGLLKSLQPQIHEYEAQLEHLDRERAALSMEWDQGACHPDAARHSEVIDRLTAVLAERGYIHTLLGSIQAAQRGESMILKH